MQYLNRKKDGNKQSSLVFNMLWSIIAVLITFLINMFVTPYVTNISGAEAYGFVTLANTLTSYIDVIAITINAFAARYISIAYHKGQYKEAITYFNSVLVSNLILSGIFLLICSILIGQLEKVLKISYNLIFDVKLLFIFVLVKYLFSMLTTVFSVGTFITNRIDLSERQKSMSTLFQGIVLLILFSVLPMHVWYVGLAGLLAIFWLLIANIRYTKVLTPELIFDIRFFNIGYVLRLISSGIWNAINNLGNVLNNGLNLLMTNLMINGTAMGQVSIGISLGTMFNVLLEAITNSFRPKLLFLYASEAKDSLKQELIKAMKFSGSLSNIIVAGYISCGYTFMELWVPTQNTRFVYSIAVIVLLGSLVVGIVKPLYYVFTMTDKLKIPCAITIVSGVINVFSMYFLLKYTDIGAYAVVLTTMVLNLVHFIDTPIYAAYCLKMKLTTFYPTIIRLFLSCFLTIIIMCFLGSFFSTIVSWKYLLVKCLICGGAGTITAMGTTFSKKELSLFFSAIFR
ncbi:hypothetical protein [Enterococcus sp. DIV0187]|uniref:hypothetical protein n=1 Tax=Enterococcus sp. DIV0187 TaxID=2774644 RepID=UPI003F265FB7